MLRSPDVKTSRSSEVKELSDNGFKFRDLNKNGKLDLYEDSRVSVDIRVEDLLSKMNIEEKTGMMWHPPIGVGNEGEILGKPKLEYEVARELYEVVRGQIT